MLLKRTALILVIMALIGAISVPTSAVFASATRARVSEEASHIVLTDSSVVIEREEFVFEIQTFDSGKLTSTYNLYNPSDEDVMLKCVLPLDKSKNVQVKVDGEAVKTNVRHTINYYGRYYAMRNIFDDFMSDIFYSPELKVTKYTYKVSDVSDGSTAITWTCKALTRNTEFMADAVSLDVTSDSATYGQWVYNDSEISFYVLGDDIDEPEMKFASSFYSGIGVSGTAQKVGVEQLTFMDIAMLYYKEESGVSEIDWYNAVVMRLKELPTIAMTMREMDIADILYDCLVYTVPLSAGQRVTNEVAMSLLPTYDALNYRDEYYEYVFNMVPASDCTIGEIEFRVVTSYYMLNSPDFSYDEQKDAYICKDFDMENNYLTFALSTSPKIRHKSNISFVKVVVSILVRLFALPLCFVVVYCGYNAIKKKRAKNKI